MRFDNFLNWFFEFMSSLLGSFWQVISNFALGIVGIFNIPKHIRIMFEFKDNFSFVEWVLAVIFFLLAYAAVFGLIFLLVLVIRKYIRFRKSLVGNEDLLEEISDLHRDVIRLTSEKEQLLALKTGVDLSGLTPYANGADDDMGGGSQDGTALASPTGASRFYRLSLVDENYREAPEPEYVENMSLEEICDDLRNFACSNARLYYEQRIIRLMIAGLASTKLIILQGISGTGKTSLPYIMGKYFTKDSTIASVQPSWRDRAELFGYFNEFTKKFNETDVLRRIYESGYTDDVNIIILDEMNISRVEYYFAEMLSILEMPNPDEWRIEIVPSSWENDPEHLKNGVLKIPQNIWYVGTANNDDSTFAISDKVYDRAFVINLDAKGIPFSAPDTNAKRISYSHVEALYKKAIEEHPVTKEALDKIEQLDNYVIEKFRVAFGNRIMKQLKIFAPVYVACGGTEVEAVDYLLATKVFRKFESLNLALIRDEIKGLISFMDALYGKDVMKECIDYLHRLEKIY